MIEDLKKFKDNLAEWKFGMSLSEAWERGVCVACKKPVDKKALKVVDAAEYRISALCPSCFEEQRKTQR